MKKLLIAIDESSSALRAAQYAIELAKSLNVEIGLVEVTNLSVGNISAGITPIEEELANQQKAASHLDQLKQIYPETTIRVFDPVGQPEHEIEKLIDIWHPDVLVMGHHSHSDLQKLFDRSLESQLIDHIKIPILVVP